MKDEVKKMLKKAAITPELIEESNHGIQAFYAWIIEVINHVPAPTNHDCAWWTGQKREEGKQEAYIGNRMTDDPHKFDISFIRDGVERRGYCVAGETS